ncbi:proton-coupled folate transporter-like isoform X1 [Nasonia vitripennis]|uniref:Proton-coupled folate transporter n=2 Tax=Nasonia vitripennis TaxID=7425 RepID=A0A7M7QLC3_NASVI|nr:proton-coupled folate transporter-like isoform X1 [Nasonia vitripennis]
MADTITGWRRFAAMEPLAFALLFAFSVSDNVMSDLFVYQTCKSTAALNISDCDILHTNSSSDRAKDIEKLVQPHTTIVLIFKSCIDTIFPTIMSLFLGPWSDKNGRKPLLVIPFTGFLLSYFSLAILSNFNANPYWFLLSSIPSSLLGGFPAILLTFFCYITDITDNQNRAWHLACIQTMILIGMLLGLFVGPAVFSHFGYAAVFCISGITCLIAVLHSIFFVKETVQSDSPQTLKSVFDKTLVKELFCAVTKKREGFDRCLVWSCILAIALHVVILEGNGAVGFYFVSSKLGWNVSQYSAYSAAQMVMSIGGMLLIIRVVGSLLKLPETVIIILSCLSTSVTGLAKAFVYKPWHMYFSASIGMFSSSATPVIRSIVSKSVPPQDLGKTFSLITTMEMTIPFATTPLYIYVYTHTLKYYPCPVWFLSAALPVFIIILAVIIDRRWRRLKESQYTPFEADIN